MKVWLSGAARACIRHEASYLRKHSRPAANALLARMSRAKELLARFPNIGVQTDDLPIPGSQRLIVGDYLLDYEPFRDGVLVTSIRHGAQARGPIDLDDDFDYEA